jgi:condensin complex subunit 1
MAEQAINTIYLLGEQPDTLCTAIIQDLHKQTFVTAPSEMEEPVASQPEEEDNSKRSTKQSTGSSFNLAKLIFAIGHVSIKHIVYLELVEREFKRRKDEVAKGKTRTIPISLQVADTLLRLSYCRKQVDRQRQQ